MPAIRELLPEGAVGSKNHFSCVAAGCLPGLPGADRAQVVLVGIEAHVCVLQTALELVEEGKEVYVVADAVGSRRPYDRDVALARMRDEGVRVVTREMVVFEWLGEAGTPAVQGHQPRIPARGNERHELPGHPRRAGARAVARVPLARRRSSGCSSAIRAGSSGG